MTTTNELKRDDPAAAVALYRELLRAGTWTDDLGEWLTMMQSTVEQREALWDGMRAVDAELRRG